MLYLNDISYGGGEIFDGGEKKNLFKSGCVRIKHMHTLSPVFRTIRCQRETGEQLSLLLRGLEEKWCPRGFNLR